MWQRFTERARRVVFFAQEEAHRLGESYVSTEHVLLGLVRENDSVAARILTTLDVPLERVREETLKQVAQGDSRKWQDMQLTPRAKRVIDLAYDEARQLNNNYIGTEHLLLGLIREGEGLAGLVLTAQGLTLERVRAEVVHVQATNEGGKYGGEKYYETAIDRAAARRLDAERVIAAQTRIRDEAEEQERELRQALADLEREKVLNGPDAPTPPPGDVGDLGVARAIEGRARVEAALDLTAFVRLQAIFAARDTHGYRAMTDGDQTVFFVADGTRLKLLAPPPASEQAPDGGCYVRVLDGDHEGVAGWIFDLCFERTGPDDAPFPPDEE